MKCSACPECKPFCHGRCINNNLNINNISQAACKFGPCSDTPYHEGSGSTCFHYAMDAQEHECKEQCVLISTDIGASSCQACLVENIPDQCESLHGSPCWYCGSSILQMLTNCSLIPQGPGRTIKCINQTVVAGCEECICTLLCYLSPTDDLCLSCLRKPLFASLFLNHQFCPQGWIFSSSSSTCLKSFDERKPWIRASRFCQNGGGQLAQPKATSSIQAVLEAVHMMTMDGRFWIGGKETLVDKTGSRNFIKLKFIIGSLRLKKYYIFSVKCASGSNDWNCCSSSSQCGLGEGDCDYDSDCTGDLVCGLNNCADGVFGLDCCTAAGTVIAFYND